MNQTELTEVLRLHKLCLAGSSEGVRADLTGANLYEANLIRANLYEANLYEANLYEANLTGANLIRANLYGANLTGANLTGANLYGANLYEADLTGADLTRANLTRANLTGANLTGAILPHFQICPTEGPFIAWKKVRGAILKLEILGERTSSLVGRKCRTNKLKVLKAFTQPGFKGTKFASQHDNTFYYQVGKVVKLPIKDFDIREECTPGLHFFMTREEAENYQ